MSEMSFTLLRVLLMAYIVSSSALFGYFLGRRRVEKKDEEPTRKSCKGCVYDLGGGICRVSEEGECREGGGFEMYRKVDGEKDE